MKTDNPKGAIPLRERRTLADNWREYAGNIMPKNAPEVQRVETRRAFYAGAAAMFGLLTGGFDADAEPTELDLQYVDSISAELTEFSRQIDVGQA